MIIAPYKRPPAPPTVAWLNRDAQVISEHGELLELDSLEPGMRVWTSYDTVRELVDDGRGEALCWLGEEIRWRHRSFEHDWKHRASDVAVLRLPFPDDPAPCLAALAAWRDWLAEHRAAPTGTTGSAAWSLLRATLTKPLYTSAGWRGKPERLIRQTLGARIQLGPAGPGSFRGPLTHYDLPAAYATELGTLPYGGCWYDLAEMMRQGGPRRRLDWWAGERRPLFVHATVKIPTGLPYGPLPRRPRRVLHGLEQMLLGTTYPTGCRLTGTWTWQELEQAVAAGAKIVKVRDAWVHIAGGDVPLARWWNAIQAGREMPGMAGTLAKITGNALWGRFCMDGRGGHRTIRSRAGAKVSTRSAPVAGGIPPAHDLAETVSGRIRARLHAVMLEAGPALVTAHTDGAWTRGDLEPSPDGWRVKERARRLDVLTPQTIRYWPAPPAPWEPGHVLAGVPSKHQAHVFSERWTQHRDQLERARDQPPKLGDTAAWTTRHATAP